MGAVILAATDELENVRINACCTLMETAKIADVSAAIPALVDATAEDAARPNASRALLSSLALPASQKRTQEALNDALTDQRDIVVSSAAVILTAHNTQQKSWCLVTSLLQRDNSTIRRGALEALDWATEGGPIPLEVVGAVAEMVTDDDTQLRVLASRLLCSLAEGGNDVSPAIAAFSQATSDKSEEVSKDAVWALYGAARQGIDISGALSALNRCVKQLYGPVAANASVAVARHYLQVGRHDDVRKMLETDPFGASWAFTDDCCASGETGELTNIVRSIRPGIRARDQHIRQGIAGSINYAQGRDPDGSIALEVIQRVLAATQDPADEAAIQGIYLQLQELQE